MRIGILTYHAACNFGAFLQLLSTVEYVRKRGAEPIVINWIPKDFETDYEKRSKQEVRNLYAELRQKYLNLTRLCRTSYDVALAIQDEKIEAVIIGSDAVIQHHPFRERFHFPCRRIFYINHPTSDRMYPNAFWGEFMKYLTSVPIAMMSGASVDSKYFYIKGKLKERMKKSILRFSYFSVRDEWSKEMIQYLTDNEVIPSITPDPVFAFNYNAPHLVPTKEDILKKYNLPERYIILSFKVGRRVSVDQEWIDEFQYLSKEQGLACVKLPYADSDAFGDIENNVGTAISPLDWYALIKYSHGYVGNNMHPIIVSLHNVVPFFSFDNYGIPVLDGRPTNGESSKIYQILKTAGLDNNRVFANARKYVAPSALDVFSSIIHFDRKREMQFANDYYGEYEDMMEHIFRRLKC